MDPSALVTEYLHENVGSMLRGGKARKDRKTGGWKVPVLCAVAGQDEKIGHLGVSADGEIDPASVEAIMDRLSELIPQHHEGEPAWGQNEAEIMASLTDLLNTIAGDPESPPMVDELTGVQTHARFQERLDQQVDGALRYRLPFCCLLVDIDAFAAFNAEHGYHLGDALLRQVAHLLSAGLRGTDIIARWGGDEFAVIAEGISADTALAAERVRRAVEEHEFRVREGDEPIKVTVSVGSAAFPTAEVRDREALLRLAQDMLVAAKAAGGNRVMLAHHDSPQFPAEKDD